MDKKKLAQYLKENGITMNEFSRMAPVEKMMWEKGFAAWQIGDAMEYPFEYGGVESNGETFFTASHELHNVVKVVFPPDYFHGMVIPKYVNVEITIPGINGEVK